MLGVAFINLTSNLKIVTNGEFLVFIHAKGAVPLAVHAICFVFITNTTIMRLTTTVFIITNK